MGKEVVISSVFDLTERMTMEQALRESETSVRRILESCPVPIVVLRTEDGHVIYESPAAKALYRLDDSSDDETTVPRWVEPENRKQFLAQLHEAGFVDSFVLENRRADGSTFWGALSARLVEFKGEQVTIASIYDLTERLEMEEEMARQRDALHQSEKLSAMGQLLASVAHELNNPLSVVVGQAMLLRETTEDPASAKRAERIGTAAERCTRIVKSFLAMARQQPQESKPVNPNDLIQSALEVTGYSLRTSGIEFSTHLARSLPPILADADQLTQVFTNLVVNAEQALRDATGAKRLRLTSRHHAQGGEVVVKIKDNGPSIPDDVRGRIFEPFFTTKEGATGTGIGLAICHRILEAHGGKIKLENTPGGGTTFVVRLPVMNETPAPADDSTDQERTSPGLSVLVIDDEPDVAELLADILGTDGHRIEIADSGSAAIERIERRDFDVVLSDVRMPGMDGPALFRSLETRSPELLSRIAFITGDTLSPGIKAFLDESGRPHIEKTDHAARREKARGAGFGREPRPVWSGVAIGGAFGSAVIPGAQPRRSMSMSSDSSAGESV